MSSSQGFFALLLSSALALPQAATGASTPSSLRVTLPITFTQTVGADRARAGDVIRARTTQAIQLPGGELVPSGSEVVGHVAAASAFAYDKTPYAVQKESVLEIHFDSLVVAGHNVPLKVTVRAMADPLASWGAREQNTADDPLATTTQVGGDQLTRSQAEVVNRDGDVVAYNRKGGVYAHLIARAGCDGSTNEVSVDIFSASACGLYGFTNVAAGPVAGASSLSLVSRRTSPKIWKHSTALLEMLPEDGAGR